MAERVFILDMVRRDGSRFVTSVSASAGIADCIAAHGAVAGTAHHWERSGPRFSVSDFRTAPDWRLQERFPL